MPILNNTCFDDFLTYNGSGITPTSGLYVNDLPGIHFTKADAVADTDYATGIEMIEDKIDYAIRLVTSEIKRFVMPYFKLHSAIGHYMGGEFDDDLGYHAVDANDRGIRIDIPESTLGRIIVNRVTVLFDSVGLNDIEITDGELTTNYAVTLVAQTEQTVEINYRANRKRIFITLDNTALQPAEGNANMSCSGYDVLDVKGWTGAGVSSNNYGIRADITVICDPDAVACLLKDVLGPAVLYRFGVEFMKEAIETDRLNYFTLLNRDQMIESLERFENDYKEEMMSLSRTIPKLLRKLDPMCIDCSQAKYVEKVP